MLCVICTETKPLDARGIIYDFNLTCILRGYAILVLSLPSEFPLTNQIHRFYPTLFGFERMEAE